MKRSTLALAGAIGLQFLILTGMLAKAAMPLWTGTEIRVKTVPVDPRSMFRGNYARLNYEFGQLPDNALAGISGLRVGEVIYVGLQPGASGLYQFATASLDQPSEGVFLRGRLTRAVAPYHVSYGIEAFFAPKQKAVQLERELVNGGVAVLKVAGSGRAALVTVVPNPSAPPSANNRADQ